MIASVAAENLQRQGKLSQEKKTRKDIPKMSVPIKNSMNFEK